MNVKIRAELQELVLGFVGKAKAHLVNMYFAEKIFGEHAEQYMANVCDGILKRRQWGYSVVEIAHQEDVSSQVQTMFGQQEGPRYGLASLFYKLAQTMDWSVNCDVSLQGHVTDEFKKVLREYLVSLEK